MKKNKLLSISNLSKIYHSKDDQLIALKDISFDVNDGDFISIVGPSGCGKSTVLSILAGIEKKTSGDIKMYKDISFGYMLQEDSLFFWKSVLDNCLIGLKIQNKLSKENIDYVISLLKTYGLYDFKDKYPNSLSGGMRQRVG